jgi:hypothetical protein
VPAAAVIPAPIAYIKVVAVKKLVVEFWAQIAGLANVSCTGGRGLPFHGRRLLFTGWLAHLGLLL